jgi:hypothetical protein
MTMSTWGSVQGYNVAQLDDNGEENSMSVSRCGVPGFTVVQIPIDPHDKCHPTSPPLLAKPRVTTINDLDLLFGLTITTTNRIILPVPIANLTAAVRYNDRETSQSPRQIGCVVYPCHSARVTSPYAHLVSRRSTANIDLPFPNTFPTETLP